MKRARPYYQWTVAGLMLIMLLAQSTAHAHPHYWIDVFAEWQFNSKGLISGVKIRWLFDDYYSVLLVNDAAETGEELPAILQKILNYTSQHEYLIRIEHQGVRVKSAPPEHPRIGVHDHRIQIDFLLPLTVPLDPQQGDIVYQIAEPTYFFEMLHAEDEAAIVLNDAPSACSYHREAPKPDASLVAYAASLGINESGADDLGNQFAETVTIQCE